MSIFVEFCEVRDTDSRHDRLIGSAILGDVPSTGEVVELEGAPYVVFARRWRSTLEPVAADRVTHRPNQFVTLRCTSLVRMVPGEDLCEPTAAEKLASDWRDRAREIRLAIDQATGGNKVLLKLKADMYELCANELQTIKVVDR